MAQENGLTRHDLETAFRELGLREGLPVEVHSSLSSFGRVAGGAETVIAALMAVVGPSGTIVMSAYPVSKVLPLTAEDKANGLTCKVSIFPEHAHVASGMGVIADTFRQRPDVVVGRGVHRVAAWGKEAQVYAEQGYEHLLAVQGYGLLLGVDINRLSSMHSVEHCVPAAFWERFQLPADIVEKYPPDRWYVEAGNQTEASGWNKIQAEAFRKKMIREQIIGKARCLFFKAGDVVGLYREALLRDPDGLFGLP